MGWFAFNNNIKELETFKYSLECYFIPSIHYSELEKVIREFKQGELPKYSAKLLEEAKYIMKLNDWGYIYRIVLKYGMRGYREKRI